MKYLSVLATLILLLAPDAFCDEKKDAKDAGKEAAETKTVSLQGLNLKVPTTWKTAKGSSMRMATYSLPKAEGDSKDAELAIFNFAGGGGGIPANLARWQKEFSSKGKTSKVVKGTAGDNEYVLADIGGTHIGSSFRRKNEPDENFRMLGVILIANVKAKGEDGTETTGKKVFFLKLIGPDKTIKSHAESYRASFGGNAKTEKELELEL